MNDLSLAPLVTREDLRELFLAKALLEKQTFAVRLSDIAGAPIESALSLLPAGWPETINRASQLALLKALDLAIGSLGKKQSRPPSLLLHKMMVGATGGVGGVFGLASLPLELPISTSLMLRSIADIAQSQGHSLEEVDTQLSCLEVFALGGSSRTEIGSEGTYWVVRAALSKAISEASLFIAERGMVETGAPAVVRLISSIASRFGVMVSEQTAAKALPILGAVGGSMINILFMDHFQDMARGHFIVKRLEKKYGMETVQLFYEEIPIG